MKKAMTGGLLACGGLLVWVVSAAQNPPAKPAPKPQETVRVTNSLDGSTLYNAYCAVCHGPGAKGDGPMAKMLVAKTPDLTRIAERQSGKFPRVRVEGIISGEAALSSGHGTREMPIWGPIFSQVSWDMDLGRVRVDNLARYIESLQEK
jgi:mono/diheme cytochrome c family protein